MRLLLGLALGLALAGCGRIIPQATASTPVVAAPATPLSANAVLAGVVLGPTFAALSVSEADARPALASFIESCPALVTRDDASGLTVPDDWRKVCDEARGWPRERSRIFFASQFQPVRIGDGRAFATGYFEPEISGSRTARPGFTVPVYAVPSDLVRAWPDDVPQAERNGRPPLGRYDQQGRFVLYHDRAAIEDGALAGKAEVIAWAADPVEFFFLQIQGSGRLRTPEGEVIRIGYAGQNGCEYVGIGGVMRERGLLGDGPGKYPGSMQGIMAYIRENPSEGRALMRLNKSWVFFRELDGDGPLGALGVPVRGRVSVAADPAYVPLGAPVWLDLDRQEASGLWIAQDTGGAIKGANRFDTFWGAGEDARVIAGGMSGRGQAYVLLPSAAAARLGTRTP
ncbi:murein transglycosylase A [Erythrobacter dokdonensis]|uniref:peptidoglycan lytic exotransglycosylase n=1 Tax=Erythrobacter dokdonensis DSW-74 TaxID=1300349 RepID=A0A1A7BBB7_9SPHN|nr:murein transglycosylase A [Erythrobacter dokdonensis]OBV09833.1 putative membrane-bound lytic murein transglycosylase A transmembrane protein [Erythrobacter dokdonensis DSW-74]